MSRCRFGNAVILWVAFALVIGSLSCSRNEESPPENERRTNDAESSEPTPSAVSTTDRLPDPPATSQPAEEHSATRLRLPGADLAIPEWAGKRADEPFSVAEYLAMRREPAGNQEEMCLRGLAPFSPRMSLLFPAEQRQEHEAEAEKLEKRLGPLADLEKMSRGGVAVDEVRSMLADLQPGLSLVDRAQAAGPCFFVTGLQLESELPHALAARNLARAMTLEFYDAAQSNDFVTIERSLGRTLRLARDLQVRGVLIQQLVSISLDVLAADSIRILVLPRADITPVHCDRILTKYFEHRRSSFDHFEEGLKVEYIVRGNILWNIEHGNRTYEEMLERPIRRESIDFDLEWPTAGRLFSMSFEYGKAPYHEVLASDPVGDELKSLRPRIGSLVVGTKAPIVTLLTMPSIKAIREATARHTARLGGLQALILIRRYELQHLRLPETLEEAFRDAAIRQLPMDPYSGEPLRYRHVGGRPVVYAIGPDQQDDQGEVNWSESTKRGDFIFRIGEL